MYVSQLPVTQAVREVLASNRLYFEVLQAGIANFTALAEKIKPDVEKKVNSNVNINTIVVAIKRLADSLQKYADRKEQSSDVIQEVRMSLTDSIIDMDFSPIELGGVSEIIDRVFERKDIPFNLFQSPKQFRLFTENIDFYNQIDQELVKQLKGNTEKKLSKITISFETGEQQSTLNNLVSEISKVLYNTYIDIHSAFFTPSEIVLIMNDNDAIKLYDALHNHLLIK
ncbi:MAG TPA: hypothetical protein VH415_17120 [Nitrososphaeraceae archaeon]|jgi:hypothetical protein